LVKNIERFTEVVPLEGDSGSVTLNQTHLTIHVTLFNLSDFENGYVFKDSTDGLSNIYL